MTISVGRRNARTALLMAAVSALVGAALVAAAPAHATPAAPATAAATPTVPFNAFTANVVGAATNSTTSQPAQTVEIDGASAISFHEQPSGEIDVIATQSGQPTLSLSAIPPAGGFPSGMTSVGAYPSATPSAAVSVGTSSYTGTGSVDLLEITRSGTTPPTITAFAADYSITPTGSTTPVTGQVRFNSSQDFTARTVDKTAISSTGLVGNYGVPQTITVAGAGSAPFTVGTPGIAGPDASYYAVRPGGSCTATTSLGYGQTCTIIVRSQPRTAGTHTALLTVGGTAGPLDTLLQIPLTVTATTPGAGTYHSLGPVRILDTRSSHAPLRPGQIRDVAVLGRGGVPRSGVSAVVLNLTVVGSTSSGYVTAFGKGQRRPTASNINFPPRFTGANMVTVAPGTGGIVDLYNMAGNTNVVVDVSGYYASNETLTPTLGVGGNYRVSEPASRVLDTRTWGHGPLPGGYYVNLAPDYGPQADPHITAFAVNITVTNPSQSGYLTAWNGDPNAVPNASVLNFPAHRTVSNMAIVPTSYCNGCGAATEAFGILNRSSGATHLVVDIVGFFDDGTYGGLRFHAMAPTRIVDTRSGLGAHTLTPPASSETRRIVPPLTVAGIDTLALVENLTAVHPTAATILTLWPYFPNVGKPAVSNLNPLAGQVIANAAITEVGLNNAINITSSAGRTDVLLDVSGRYDLFPSYTFGNPAFPSAVRAARSSAVSAALAHPAAGAGFVSTPRQ